MVIETARASIAPALAALTAGARRAGPAPPRAIRISIPTGAAAICVLLAFACGAYSSSPASGAQGVTGVLAKHKHLRCQRQHGKTILRRGVVRIFETSGSVYGCVEGSLRIVNLWETEAGGYGGNEGSVKEVAGRFVAVQFSHNDQYGFEESLTVVDLGSGREYSVASVEQPIWGEARGEPATPGPLPLEAFALGSDGRTARLYPTFWRQANPDYDAAPSGQVLDLIGFHRFRRQLAVSGPGEIAATSLSYRDHTLSWTQNGAPRSAGS